MALCYFQSFSSIFSHVLFLAAHDKLLTWKTSLLLFILCLLLFFPVFLASSYVSFKTWPKSLFFYKTFPGSHSGRGTLYQHLCHAALINVIIYHSVVQSLAYLTVFLPDCELTQIWDFCLYYQSVILGIQMFVECINEKNDHILRIDQDHLLQLFLRSSETYSVLQCFALLLSKTRLQIKLILEVLCGY